MQRLKKILLFFLLTACFAFSYAPLAALNVLMIYAFVLTGCVAWAFFYSFFYDVLKDVFFARKLHRLFLFLFFLSLSGIHILFTAVAFQEHPGVVLKLFGVFALLFAAAFAFFRHAVVFLALLSAFSVYNSVMFLYVPSLLKPEDARRIAAQKEVKPLFWFSDEITKKSALHGTLVLPKKYGSIRTVFMDREEKFLYCILHAPPAPRMVLLKFNVKRENGTFVLDKKFSFIRADEVDKAGLKAALLDEKNKKIYAASTGGKLLMIDSETLKILRDVNTDMTRLMQLYEDKPRKRILVLTENGEIKSYSLPYLMAEKKSEFHGNPYAVFPNGTGQSIYIVQGGKGSIVEFDLDKFEVLRDYKSSAFFPMGAYMDSEKGELYITDYFFGYLRVVDVRDFMETEHFRLRTGVRELMVDKKRKQIYVGQFQKGLVYVLKMGKRTIEKEIFAGKQIRHIYLSPKTNTVLTATAYGVFQLNVDGKGK